jgi:hypothetical protein
MFRFMFIDKKKDFMNLCHKQEKRFVTLKCSALVLQHDVGRP